MKSRTQDRLFLCLEGIDSKTVDILTLSETWLDGNICDTEINLPGFVCIRQDCTGIKEGYAGMILILGVRNVYGLS